LLISCENCVLFLTISQEKTRLKSVYLWGLLIIIISIIYYINSGVDSDAGGVEKQIPNSFPGR